MNQRPLPDVQHALAESFRAAIVRSVGDEYATVDPLIRPANRPNFGDYQANLAMGLAKKLRRSPRDVAQSIVDRLDTAGLCERVEIAGPALSTCT